MPQSENVDPRQVGETYYSNYWRQNYTVLERWESDGVIWFHVKWADGEESIHCTPYAFDKDHKVQETQEGE